MDKPVRWMTRSYALLWQGSMVSQMGTQVFLVTMALWLKQFTDSATVVGTIMMVGSLPAVLLAPFGGALVDRYPRRTLLVIVDTLKGLTILGVAAVLYWMPDSVPAVVASLFAAAAIGGIVGAASTGAAASLVPDLVPREKLATVNSFGQATMQVCSLLAQGLAGLLFSMAGAPLLALLNGLSYLYAAASEAFIAAPAATARRAPAQAKLGFKDIAREIRDGLRYIQSQGGMRMLFYTMTFLRFFLVPMSVLFPFYVDEHLLAGPEWYGFLLAGMGFGSLIGYVGAGAVRLAGPTIGRVVVGMMIAISACFAGLGLVAQPSAALLLVTGIGAMSGFVSVRMITALQLATPSAMRGRVFGLLATIAGGLAPVAMGLTGVIVDLVNRNLSGIYLVCGAMTAALSLTIALRRECRAFLAGEAAVPPAAAVPAQGAA